MDELNLIKDNLAIILPIFILQVLLMVVALIDLFKRETTKGPKAMWAIIIIFINLVGPIIYFIIGRNSDE